MTTEGRSSLLSRAEAFSRAFAGQRPLDEIISFFSTSANVLIFENGLQELAPFMGREYKGPDRIRDYFTTNASVLKCDNMQNTNFIVDADQSQVAVRGTAHFTSLMSGQSWDEVFIYVLDFDETSKIVKWEIWADSGAAYLASKGQLK